MDSRCPTPSFTLESMTSNTEPEISLSLSHLLRVKAAEYWLRQGDAHEALQELDRLPPAVSQHSSAIKARVAAMGILRERNEMPVSK